MSEDLHRLEIEAVDRWVSRCADRLAEAVAGSVAARGRCLMALSGGSTPGPVLAELGTRELDWDRVTVIQVDERLVPADDPARNLATLRSALDSLPVAWLTLPVDRLLERPPAGTAVDPEAAQAPAAGAQPAAGVVAEALVELADDPPVLDVVQLGLGSDGHTASLMAGDPAVMELRRYVALTRPYQGRRRLTLTRPVFDRARSVIWLVRGAEKAEPLGRLLAGDLSIPAGVIRPRRSLVLADTDAARQR
jgi:6-phosphogluconolactonase